MGLPRLWPFLSKPCDGCDEQAQRDAIEAAKRSVERADEATAAAVALTAQLRKKAEARNGRSD